MSNGLSDQPTAPIAALLDKPVDQAALSPEAAVLQRLLNTIGRANALFELEPIPVVFTRRPAETQRRQVKKQRARKHAETKIALHSVPITIFESEGLSHRESTRLLGGDLVFERFDHFDLCLRHPLIEPNRSSNWCQDLLANYRAAGQEEAEFICSNELGFPSFWSGRPPISGRDGSTADFLNNLKDFQRRKFDFEHALQRIALDHSCVILPGTYHDHWSFENVAPVVFPHERNTIESRKYTSAHSVGESIKVARLRRIPVYVYGSLVFSVLICSDAFDLNIFFRCMIDRLGSDKYRNVDIFFVPSFYRSSRGKRNAMLDACQQLSWATGSVVIFVNSCDGGEVSKAVFMCGDEVWRSRDAGVEYYTIDWKKFYKKLQEWIPGRIDIYRKAKTTAR